MAGLACGIYSLLNGFQTTIIEKNKNVGGVAAAFRRDRYIVDGAMHWLVGVKEGSSYFQLWKELGILEDVKIIELKEFARFELASGKVFSILPKIDLFEEHFSELFPEDRSIAREIAVAARIFRHFNPPIDEPVDFFGKVRLVWSVLPFGGLFLRYNRMTVREFVNAARSSSLKEILPSVFEFESFPMTAFLVNLAWFDSGWCGYPDGGAGGMIDRLEKRYRALGGNLLTGFEAEEIVVEDMKAKGVIARESAGIRPAESMELKKSFLSETPAHVSPEENKTKIFLEADYVVSAMDGYQTLFRLLKQDFVNREIVRYYNEFELFPGPVHIALGVRKNYGEIPSLAFGLRLPLEESFNLGGISSKWLPVHIYNFTDKLAPPDSTLITIMLYSDYSYWKKLSEDRVRYEEEKRLLARKVIERLEQRFPGTEKAVEMVDVATPLTYERRTGNRCGAFEGWLLTGKNLAIRLSKSPTVLPNFFMCGQWVEAGGGFPRVASSGRGVIQLIVKREGRKFINY